MFARIIPFKQSFDDFGFTYCIPPTQEKDIQPGMVVKIPFGKNLNYGLIMSIFDEFPEDVLDVKDIIEIYGDRVFLNTHQLKIIDFIIQSYFSLAHSALGLFFPSNMLQKILKNTFSFDIPEKEIHYTYNNSHILTSKQTQIIDEIVSSPSLQFLLYGITGSGKTEIYISLIRHYILQEKQSLLLVPEIILTSQIYKRIVSVFGDEVIVINSSVSEAIKTKYWKNIYHKKAKIIIGTRSALFYPYQDLGVIIVDEEHDGSYISETSPRYNGVEVAIEMSKIYGSKLVMGSGTPNISRMYRATRGEFEVLQLLDTYTQVN